MKLSYKIILLASCVTILSSCKKDAVQPEETVALSKGKVTMENGDIDYEVDDTYCDCENGGGISDVRSTDPNKVSGFVRNQNVFRINFALEKDANGAWQSKSFSLAKDPNATGPSFTITYKLGVPSPTFTGITYYFEYTIKRSKFLTGNTGENSFTIENYNGFFTVDANNKVITSQSW